LPLRARVERQHAELLAQRFELQTEHRGRHQPTGNEHNVLRAVAGFKVMQAQTVAIGEELAADRRGQRRKAGHAADQKCQDSAEFHARRLQSSGRKSWLDSPLKKAGMRGLSPAPHSVRVMRSSPDGPTRGTLRCLICMHVSS